MPFTSFPLSLHGTASTLRPLQGASILSPTCLPLPIPLPLILLCPLLPLTSVPSTPPAPWAAADASALCCVRVWCLGGGGGLGVAMGWAECGGWGGVCCLFPDGIWQAAASAMAWSGENPPGNGAALGEGLVLPRFPLVPPGTGPGLALL